MASTAAERKAKERQLKKEQDMTLKQIWLSREAMDLVDRFKRDFEATDEDAINALIKSSSEKY